MLLKRWTEYQHLLLRSGRRKTQRGRHRMTLECGTWPTSNYAASRNKRRDSVLSRMWMTASLKWS